ncbi:MAG: hypothetical protein KME19_00100 [Microcoleus vaginatus WJT46-NPBG5]|nr:hypothetical protein [Microcoleus vaginatus WJT46-NPBG5]
MQTSAESSQNPGHSQSKSRLHHRLNQAAGDASEPEKVANCDHWMHDRLNRVPAKKHK